MEDPSRTSVNLETSGDLNVEDEVHERYRSTWFFSKEEIEKISPSRKDGVDQRKESQLRMLYCSFLRDIGIRLGLPQVTIATAIMFCHRFYLHQSHVKNEWQMLGFILFYSLSNYFSGFIMNLTVATVCMFLASKVEETPCGLEKVAVVAYETIYREDPAAARRIRQRGILERQKRLILIGERVLLSTIRFDFNVLHPYKPLLDALKKLGITQKEIKQVAWNYVNDWFWTTLCLQYKPHYIAAGSLFLAAKRHNFKLPSERGYVWWHEFDVNPQQLEVVIHQMKQLLEFSRRSSVMTPHEKPVQDPIAGKKEVSSSPDSVLNRTGSSSSSLCQETVVDPVSHKGVDSCNHVLATVSNAEREQSAMERKTESQTSCEIPSSVAGHNVNQAWTKQVQVTERLVKVDVDRIKTTIKKRKREREMRNLAVTVNVSGEDDWIERELEAGIEIEDKSVSKKQMSFRPYIL